MIMLVHVVVHCANDMNCIVRNTLHQAECMLVAESFHLILKVEILY